MQLRLPIFPFGCKLISNCLGVQVLDGLVQYIVNGLPVYAHSKDDRQSFRYFTSNLIHQGLCRKADIQHCFHVSEDTVQRAYKLYVNEGPDGFFGVDARRGQAHKIVGECRIRIQKKLDDGRSVNSIAKQEGLRESAIRYAINQGYLKKKDTSTTSIGTTVNNRDESDRTAPMGIATTRYEDRLASAVCGVGNANAVFEAHDAVCGAGVLFLLPALLLQGLLKTKELYTIPQTLYYGLESIILTLSFMALARIKNPEQLKQCKPGELGKIIGLDRVPEVKCLREKIKLLTEQHQARNLNNLLIDHWYDEGDSASSFLYIDGHVRIYYGEKANLPSKFVSRQRLCLSATTDFWVNDSEGLPVMVVTGELTEKLTQAIEEYVIPELEKTNILPTPTETEEKISTADTEAAKEGQNADAQEEKAPVCTLVFDREAYEPDFFARLWAKKKIAVLTYRKNVKDKWEESAFKEMNVTVLSNIFTMLVCERITVLGGVRFREIRRLSDGHQTAIITTNWIISTAVAAGKMFGRWVQENFFRYLIMDYDFDKMIAYSIHTIDENKEVVNPAYRKLEKKMGKIKIDVKRIQAQIYNLTEQGIDLIDEIERSINKQATLLEQLEVKQTLQSELKKEMEGITKKIKLKDMPDKDRYNKLEVEGKLFMNIIKMICYRAETAVANEIAPFLKNEKEERRMLVKQIIQNNADIVPDYENKTLTIILHSLSAPRFNKAAEHLALILTKTETVFPGTDLTLIFKTSAC